jgi:hypothetical protein
MMKIMKLDAALPYGVFPSALINSAAFIRYSDNSSQLSHWPRFSTFSIHAPIAFRSCFMRTSPGYIHDVIIGRCYFISTDKKVLCVILQLTELSINITFAK